MGLLHNIPYISTLIEIAIFFLTLLALAWKLSARLTSIESNLNQIKEHCTKCQHHSETPLQ